MKGNQEFKYMHQLDDSRLSQIDAIRARRFSLARWPLVVGAFLSSLALGALGPLTFKLMAQGAAPTTEKYIEAEEIATSDLDAIEVPVKASKTAGKKAPKIPLGKVLAAAAIGSSKGAPPLKKETEPAPSTQLNVEKGPDLETKPSFAMTPAEPKKQSSVTDLPSLNGTDLSAEYAQATINALLVNPSANLDPTDVSPESINNDAYVNFFNASYQKNNLKTCKRRCLLRATDASGKKIFAVIDGPNFADVLLSHKGTINLTGQNRMVKNRELFMVQNITFNLAPGEQVLAKKMRKKSKTPALKPASFKKKPRLKMQGFEDLREAKVPSI